MAEKGTSIAEWRAGWQTVLVASLGISLSTAHIYSQGLFMAPLEQAFGWSRAEITSGPFLMGIIGGAGILFSGALADRFGARRVVLPGLLLYALAQGTLMLTSGSLVQWYGSWLLMAVIFPLITPTIWTAAVVVRFRVARGLALATALAGTGLSSAFAPVIIEWLIESQGWRAGFAFFPAFAALVIFPLTLLMFDRGARPEPPAAEMDGQAHSRRPAPSVGTLMRSPPFILLLTASVSFAFCLMALMAHLVPIVTEGGLDRGSAAAAVGVVGLCSIAGRLTTGFLIDRLNSAIVATITFLLPLVPVFMLIHFNGSLGMAMGAAVILGLSLGAEVDVIAFLTAHRFGSRRYATFVGLIQGTTALAVGGGPLFGGLIHDKTGSYSLLLWACVPLFLLGAAAIITLGRIPVRDHDGMAET